MGYTRPWRTSKRIWNQPWNTQEVVQWFSKCCHVSPPSALHQHMSGWVVQKLEVWTSICRRSESRALQSSVLLEIKAGLNIYVLAGHTTGRALAIFWRWWNLFLDGSTRRNKRKNKHPIISMSTNKQLMNIMSHTRNKHIWMWVHYSPIKSTI